MERNFGSPGKLTAIYIISATLAIYALSAFFSRATLPSMSGLINTSSFAQKNFIVKLYMLILTGVVMLLQCRKKAADFGFTPGNGVSYGLYTKKAILFGLLGLAVVFIVNITGFIITRNRPVGFPPEKLINMIIFIWIWSSIVEEILFRGLLQSWLSDVFRGTIQVGKLRLSIAVLLAALIFASLHLMLLFQGMSAVFVTGIFLNAFIVGLTAGYYREKSGSLYPAIYIHMLCNIVGSLPLLLTYFVR